MKSYTFHGSTTNDFAGYSLSNVGDIDGDGRDDFIIGANRVDSNGKTDTGAIYFVSGADLAALDFASGTDGKIELSDVAASSKSYQFNGILAGDQAGKSVSFVGDVDGDNITDFIIGARYGDGNGTDSGDLFLISGADLAALDTAGGAAADGVIELSDVATTGSSYQFDGADPGDRAGSAFSSLGDVDGDSIDDFIIGAFYADISGKVNAGAAYFISGADLAALDAASGTDGVIDLADVLCFARGTLIQTQLGEVPIEQLEMGHRVLTMDDGYQPIRWIGRTALSRADLEANPKLKPIRIRADALGPGLPKQDLLVSPQHRVLVRSAIAHRMFDAHEVLIPANKLLTLPGIDIEWEADGVDYFHILFDAHQLVWSNGAVTESLFTGPEALKAVSPEAREEIETLFPEIARPDFVPTAVRFIPEKGKHMKTLTQRLVKNNKIAQESHGLHM